MEGRAQVRWGTGQPGDRTARARSHRCPPPGTRRREKARAARPAPGSLTRAGEEGLGQVLWVVASCEQARGRGPAEQVPLGTHVQLVGVRLHLLRDRACPGSLLRKPGPLSSRGPETALTSWGSRAPQGQHFLLNPTAPPPWACRWPSSRQCRGCSVPRVLPLRSTLEKPCTETRGLLRQTLSWTWCGLGNLRSRAGR